MTLRRLLFVIVAALAGLALAAGCGGGDDDGGEGTIEQLRVLFTSGGQELRADVWTLVDGPEEAWRSRLRDDDGVVSDAALRDGVVSLYTRETGAVVEVENADVPFADPFRLAEQLVEEGDLKAAGTVRADGRTFEAFTGPPGPLILAGAEGRATPRPAGATARYLRDAATGRPYELRTPAARLALEGTDPANVPARRFLVTATQERPATGEALAVFDISEEYSGP